MSTVSLATLLRELIDPESIARWPEPEFRCLQVSSYDRATVAPDKPGWFANDDFNHYLRTENNEGRTERVLMDADGPGAIVRFWLTAGGEKDGVLRVYLDGQSAPAIRFEGFDLLRSDLKVGPPLAHPHPGYSPRSGGCNLYLPIPYARHCKVTWEERSGGQRYYHINYRTYAPGTDVSTFTAAQLEGARPQIRSVNKTLDGSPRPARGRTLRLRETLAPGARVDLELPPGSNAVRALELRLEPADLRSVVVELAFDGETTLWCPATDFFGSGVGINPLRSWYRSVDADGAMRCRWVMPYRRAARISLIQLGAQPVAASLRAIVAPWKWDERSLHFHGSWHQEAGLKTPPLRDWNYITIEGRGVYAGDSLALFNAVATWYGEGDEKIWVDGESFPSHMGTGTEDYYGYSYAPQGIIQTPFYNQVRVDERRTRGWNVLSRTRQLDGIPFHRSLRFDIELISWKPTTLLYAATTYWYAAPGATSNVRPQPADAAAAPPTLAAIQAAERRPGAVECEALRVVGQSPDVPVAPQEMDPWGRERWSGGEHLLAKATRIGDFIELELPAPDSAPRRLVLYATLAPDYGVLQFRVNGTPSRASFDGWADQVRPSEPIPLGVFAPEGGRFRIRVSVSGANPSANGARYYFALDCVVLEPVS